MKAADPEVHRLLPSLTIWHRYDSSVKAELFSTALGTGLGAVLIDPIERGQAEFDCPIAAVVATNANHLRAAASYAAKYGARIFAAAEAEIPDAIPIGDGEKIAGELRVISIEGAAPGEIALFSEREGGSLVVGDALINFGTHGFTFLPPKYCTNAKLMRKSLRKLLEFQFERILFAHGTPITKNARERLASLLNEKP